MSFMPNAPAGYRLAPRPAAILRCMLLSLALASLSAGGLHGQQSESGRLTLQAYGGVAFPFSDLADGVGTGFTLGGRATLPLARSVGVYGGYSLNRFGPTDGEGNLDISGPEAGIVVRLHTVVPLDLSVGGAYYDVSTSGLATNASCKPALAGQLGLAAEVPVGGGVSATAGAGVVFGFDPDYPCGTEPWPWPWKGPKGGWGGVTIGIGYRI